MWSRNWSDNPERQSIHEYAQRIGNIFLTTDHEMGRFQIISPDSQIPFHDKILVCGWVFPVWVAPVLVRHQVIYPPVQYPHVR